MREQKQKYRIILADENRFFSDALKSYLENYNDIEVITTCNTIADIIKYTNCYDFDLLILDLSFNGVNCINHLKDFRPNKNEFKIICLSGFDNTILQQEILSFGIDYVVSKNDSIDNFPNLIKSVITNNVKCNIKKDVSLTQRQVEIIKACYEFHTEKEIAKALSISVNTLKSHKQNIFSNLNVKNNIELIKYAIKERLLVI